VKEENMQVQEERLKESFQGSKKQSLLGILGLFKIVPRHQNLNPIPR